MIAYETPSLKEIIPTKVYLPRQIDSLAQPVAATDFSLGLQNDIESNATDPIILSFGSPKERAQRTPSWVVPVIDIARKHSVRQTLLKGEYVGDVYLLVNKSNAVAMESAKISNQMCFFKSYLITEDDPERKLEGELEDFQWMIFSCEQIKMKNFTMDVQSVVKSVKIFQSKCFDCDCQENSHCQVKK